MEKGQKAKLPKNSEKQLAFLAFLAVIPPPNDLLVADVFSPFRLTEKRIDVHGPRCGYQIDFLAHMSKRQK